MRLFFVFLIINVSIFISAQNPALPVFENTFSENRFDHPENLAMDQPSQVQQDVPSNPGDPVPIDGYIPVLLVVAAALLVSQKNRLAHIAE